MKDELKRYLERIAVYNENRFSAITGLLDELGIKYEVQSKSYVRRVPVYETEIQKPAELKAPQITQGEIKSVPLTKQTEETDNQEVISFISELTGMEGIDKQAFMSYISEVAEMDGIEVSEMSEEDLSDYAYVFATLYSMQQNVEDEILEDEESVTEEDYALSDYEKRSEEADDLQKKSKYIPEREIYLGGEDDISYGYRRSRYRPCRIVRYEEEYEEIRNIIIPLRDYSDRKLKKKIVFMAHYDAVSRSTGANDNGSAVAILIAFAQEVMRRGSELPMEIVFTDREECGGFGATMYEEEYKSSILEIINLDTCGVGEDIVTCDWSMHPSKLTWKLIYGAALEEIRPVFVRSLPYCDADNMKRCGHEVTGICVLPKKDVRGIIYGKPQYSETYQYIHNGKKDDISYINYDIMDKLLRYICLLLK